MIPQRQSHCHQGRTHDWCQQCQPWVSLPIDWIAGLIDGVDASWQQRHTRRVVQLQSRCASCLCSSSIDHVEALRHNYVKVTEIVGIRLTSISRISLQTVEEGKGIVSLSEKKNSMSLASLRLPYLSRAHWSGIARRYVTKLQTQQPCLFYRPQAPLNFIFLLDLLVLCCAGIKGVEYCGLI